MAISHPLPDYDWDKLSHHDQRWVFDTTQRRALHKVPRRPYPAEQWKEWKPPAPIVLKSAKPEKKEWPGFWLWLGNSRLLWFFLDTPSAIKSAWRQAERHAKSTFSMDDSFLCE